MYWHSRAFRHVTARAGQLAVGGLVAQPSFGLALPDLGALPAAFQVPNVGAYAAVAKVGGPPIQGVRLAALIELCGAHPEALLANVFGRNGFVATLWRREIEPLAIVAYARDGQPLAAELGGPYRLLVPGLRDEARDVWDLAVIEFSAKAAPRPRNRRGLPPAHSARPGDVQGGLPRAVPDPAEPRTIVAPPP